jgi:hypothetical protein
MKPVELTFKNFAGVGDDAGFDFTMLANDELNRRYVAHGHTTSLGFTVDTAFKFDGRRDWTQLRRDSDAFRALEGLLFNGVETAIQEALL